MATRPSGPSCVVVSIPVVLAIQNGNRVNPINGRHEDRHQRDGGASSAFSHV